MLSTKLTVCLGLLFVINIEAAPGPEPWHLPNLPPLYPQQPPFYPPQPPFYPPQPPFYPPQPPMYPPQPPIYRPQPPMGSIFDLFDDVFKPWGMSSSGNQGMFGESSCPKGLNYCCSLTECGCIC